jgi:hypothetical protein
VTYQEEVISLRTGDNIVSDGAARRVDVLAIGRLRDQSKSTKIKSSISFETISLFGFRGCPK